MNGNRIELLYRQSLWETIGGGTSEFVVGYPNEYEGTLTQLLLDNGVTVKPDPENPSLFQWFLGTIFPYLLIFGVFIFILMQMQGSVPPEQLQAAWGVLTQEEQAELQRAMQ